MLEIIIRQDGEQVGQLQFDRKSWKHEDALKVLSIYLSREVPTKVQKEELASPRISLGKGVAEPDSLLGAETFEAPQDLLAVEGEHVPKEENLSSLSPSDTKSGSEETLTTTPQLKSSDYEIIDKFAVGKKRAMKYKGNNITGNHIATLLSIKALGGKISRAGDMTSLLEKDSRYDSQYRGGTYRTILLTLTELGFVEKLGDDVRRITNLGREVAAMFVVLPKSEIEFEATEIPS